MRYALDESKSAADLIRELRDEGLYLLRQELALARQETSENIARIGKHTGFLAAGGIIAACGVLVLLGSAGILAAVLLQAAGLSTTVSIWLGPALVGLLVTTIGAVLCMKAIRTFKDSPLMPKQTLETIKEEREWVCHRTGK